MNNLLGGVKKKGGHYEKKKIRVEPTETFKRHSFLAIAKKRLVLQSQNIFFFYFRQFPFEWYINVSKKKDK